MKQWRFFFHYNKQTGGMTVHWRGRCIPVKRVVCNAPCETKYNKTQPRVVMQGFTSDVMVVGEAAHIHHE